MDRPLRPGETFYSVVTEVDEEFVRNDVSAEAWEGPPEDAIGWWKGKMPESGTGKMRLAPNHVLVELLRQMADDPNRGSVAYLLGLMLMRKRAVRLMELDETDNPEGSMTLEIVADGSQLQLTEHDIPESERTRIRDELSELLYCEVEES